MAVRPEELVRPTSPGVVLQFPTGRARAGARRLQRKTRLRRTLLVLAGIGTALTVVLSGPGGTAVASRPSAPGSVVIQPGDTLWGLAERYAPGGIDPRAYVDAVVELNSLEGVLEAGARVRLP